MLKEMLSSAALCALLAAAPAAHAVNVLILHDVTGMEITKDKNMCVMCHADDYARAGKPAAKGRATAMPADHWAKGKDGKMVTADERWNCAVCHSPAKNN